MSKSRKGKDGQERKGGDTQLGCDWRTGGTKHVSELGTDVAAEEKGVL